MESYFEALGVHDEATKVRTASLYLSGVAALWWRRKHADAERGASRIERWEDFKKELKKHFYPENVIYEARKKLRELRQKGSITEYVNEFTTIMLQIPNMSDEDLMFHFIDGLQTWVKQEVRRRNVETLDEAIAAAEAMIEFYRSPPKASERAEESSNTNGGGEKEPKGTSEKPGISRKEYEEKKASYVPKRGCFVCNGPHQMKNCPKLGSLSAIVGEHDAKEDQEVQHMGSLQLLNTIKADIPTTTSKGLLYVESSVKGARSKALVDTGATHNFMAMRIAKERGVRYTRVDGEWRTINSKATPVWGRAWDVPIRLGEWKGRVDFLVVDMEDEDMVLGMEFLRKVAPVQFNEDMLSITHGGKVFDIPIEASQGMGAKVSSMRAYWRLRARVPRTKGNNNKRQRGTPRQNNKSMAQQRCGSPLSGRQGNRWGRMSRTVPFFPFGFPTWCKKCLNMPRWDRGWPNGPRMLRNEVICQGKDPECPRSV